MVLDIDKSKSYYLPKTEQYHVVIKGDENAIKSEKEFRTYLIKHGCPITEVTEELHNQRRKLPLEKPKVTTTKKSNSNTGKEIVIDKEEVNSFTSKLFWWLRYSHLNRQTKKWLIKTNRHIEEYSIMTGKDITEVVTILQHIQVSKTKSLYDEVTAQFNKNFNSKLSFYRDYCIKNKDGDTIVKKPNFMEYLEKYLERFNESPLMKATVSYSDIKLISNDVDVPCFNYIDLDKLHEHEGTPTPIIDGWMNAYFSPVQVASLRAYFYGIFNAKFNSRQAIYIEDLHGKTGKSTLLRALKTYMESISTELVCTFNSKSMNKEFAFSPFLNKRLAMDSDLKNPNIFMTEVFHKISGGDPCSIEFKGQDPFTATLHCKCILVGNIAINVNVNAEHEKSRVIYLKMKKAPVEYLKSVAICDEYGNIEYDKAGSFRFRQDYNFEDAITKEMPAFIANSRKYYEELSNGGEIYIHDEIRDALDNGATTEITGLYNEIVDSKMVLDPSGVVLSNIMYKIFKECYTDYFSNSKNIDFDYSDFKKFLQIKYSVEMKQKTINKKRVRCFVGIRVDEEEVKEF